MINAFIDATYRKVFNFNRMIIAIASPLYPESIDDAVDIIKSYCASAAKRKAEIICFPETYIPGYPLNGFHQKTGPEQLTVVRDRVCEIAAAHKLAIIVPMDWYENGKFLNTAQVISSEGKLLGYQAKVQLDPSEDNSWQAGTSRQIFEVNKMKFGISICHEGFRYPETVRWAAREGAQIVFHPHFAGSNTEGRLPTAWGSMENCYYEKAMMMRALENTIYFASSNYTTRFPESASSIIDPDGNCITHSIYGEAGILVQEIDLSKATGLLARRFKTTV
jgi:5-aminopentanamidase